MSTYYYARMTRRAEVTNALKLTADGDADTPENQASALAQRLAALVPAEVLMAYGIGLEKFVSKDSGDGSTTVAEPNWYKWSIPILAALSLIGFLLSKRKLDRTDLIRMLIPPSAFVAWTLLTGSTALSLWKWFNWVSGEELYVGAIVGVVALFLAIRFTVKSL